MSDELLKRLDGVAEMGVGGSELCGLAAASIRALTDQVTEAESRLSIDRRLAQQKIGELQSQLAAARADADRLFKALQHATIPHFNCSDCKAAIAYHEAISPTVSEGAGEGNTTGAVK